MGIFGKFFQKKEQTVQGTEQKTSSCYTARKTSTGSISIDGNGENFNYNLKIPGMIIDEINDLLRSYEGKDPVEYLKSKETEMYDKIADFDGDVDGENSGESKIEILEKNLEVINNDISRLSTIGYIDRLEKISSINKEISSLIDKLYEINSSEFGSKIVVVKEKLVDGIETMKKIANKATYQLTNGVLHSYSDGKEFYPENAIAFINAELDKTLEDISCL